MQFSRPSLVGKFSMPSLLLIIVALASLVDCLPRSHSESLSFKNDRYKLQNQLNRKDVIGHSPDWQKYVRAPTSDIIKPQAIVNTNGSVKNADALLSPGGRVATLTRAAGSSTVPSITVDFGLNVAGYLSIKFAGASKQSPGIRLAFSETLQYLTDVSDFSRSDNGDTITPGSDQIAVAEKPYTWTDVHGCQHGTQVCADGLHGFRYVKIYLDALAADAPYTNASGTVNIDYVSLKFSGIRGTVDTFTGWFESSDNDLNQWWYDAVYTNDLATDVFEKNSTEPRNAYTPTLDGKLVLFDGAKRDRDPYVGDLAVASRTSYLTHDLAQASRNVLADLADHQRDDGWIPPASIASYTLPLLDYPLWWVVCSYDLLVYRGDHDYISKYYSTLLKVLDQFYPSVTDNTTNLITKGVGVSGGYGDYAFLPRTGPITYYNALYVLALKNAAVIAKSQGHPKDADRWISRANNVSAALNSHNFDNSAGAFFDGTCGDTYCATHAQDGNSISILSGTTNRTRSQSILSYLSTHNSRFYGNSFYDNDLLQTDFSQRVYAFMSYFEIEARFQTHLVASALDQIRRTYRWMANNDPKVTMWEGIGPNGSPYEQGFTSMAHGWSTGIVPALTNFVLGVTPTGPGFQTWTIKPMPGDVSWARGVVPTPKGDITVAWSISSAGSFALSIETPAGTSGTVSVPVKGDGQVVLVDGKEAWSKDGATAFGAESAEDGYVSLTFEGGVQHLIVVGDGA
ncbi:alpha-L-rhamnosidase A protein [Rutstroemia sp. NJR-2017a WRK4]|nr:alpha-L-rhamnosidase A protein [Rutstroemia sp. NJR-2017a WRK4]